MFWEFIYLIILTNAEHALIVEGEDDKIALEKTSKYEYKNKACNSKWNIYYRLYRWGGNLPYKLSFIEICNVNIMYYWIMMMRGRHAGSGLRGRDCYDVKCYLRHINGSLMLR